MSTAPNPTPPLPARPALISAGQANQHQLQIWAAKMSGGRRAVVMVNAFNYKQRAQAGWYWGAATITAHWHDLWIGGNASVYSVRDAINHKELGHRSGSVSMEVDVHDVAVLILSPATGSEL